MKHIKLLVLLVLSGIISTVIHPYLPGLIFGIILGTWFFTVHHIDIKKIIAWIIVSTIDFIAAFTIVLSMIMSSNFNIMSGDKASTAILSFVVTGFIGALVLALSTYLLIKKLSIKQIVMVTIAGSIAGAPFILFVSHGELLQYLPFILWQCLVGMLLNYFVTKNTYYEKNS